MLLDDRFLKYFGWTLSDKFAGVRSAVLKTIRSIYAASVEGGTMEGVERSKLLPFTARFLPRIFEIAADVDETVALEAVKVLRLLLDEGFMAEEEVEESIKDEQIDKVDVLVFDPECGSELRREAMLFALSHMESFEDEDEDETAQAFTAKKRPGGSKGKKAVEEVSDEFVQRRSAEQLDELLEFCSTHVGDKWFVVDSLVESMAGTKEVSLGTTIRSTSLYEVLFDAFSCFFQY